LLKAQARRSHERIGHPERLMKRALCHSFALLLVMCTCRVARAETRVAIHEFFGPHASALRDQAENTLKRRDALKVISKQDVDAAAHNLGIDLFSPAGRKNMARELGLAAWVTGVVRKQARRLHLTVVVYDGAEHTSVGRAVLVGRNMKDLQAALRRSLWPKAKDAILLALAPLPPGRAPISDAPVLVTSDVARDAVSAAELPVTSTPPVGALAPPASAEPSNDPTRSAAPPEASSSTSVVATPHSGRADTASPEPARVARPEALRAALGIGTPVRKLAYSDPLTQSLGDYLLPAMSILDLSVVYYPGRSFTDGWASWFGLDLAAQVGLGGAESTDRQGQRFRAHYDAYKIGMRVRAPVKSHFLSAFSGYAIQRLSFSSESEGVDAPTPDVDYRMVRFGAGTELRVVQALLVGVDAAWLHLLSVGEVAHWFPRATAGGFELALNLSYALGHRMFARLSTSYQRVVFDFHARPGDERVAGGASDQVFTASLGIGVGI
jgi:hypothetical protein